MAMREGLDNLLTSVDHLGLDQDALGQLIGAANEGDLVAATAGYMPLPRAQFKLPTDTRPTLEGHPELAPLRRQEAEWLGPHGRLFLRYSGTEPVLRVLVEGEDARGVEQMTTAARAALKRILT